MAHSHVPSTAAPGEGCNSAPVTTAGLAEIYDTDRFGQLYGASRQPPTVNLGLAACFLSVLFRQHSVPYAFLGGWAVYLRGSGRSTEDIDVTVDSTMERLEDTLRLEPRVCIPLVHGPTSIQIFVHTGDSWDFSAPHTPPFTVSIDIIVKGHLGTPTDLSRNTETIQPIPDTLHGPVPVPVISLFYQLTAKLQAHSSRGTETTSDYDDLVFLLGRYPSHVWAFRGRFNRQHAYEFWADVAARDGSPSGEHAAYTAQLLGLSEASSSDHDVQNYNQETSADGYQVEPSCPSVLPGP